jgi:hypothetical protein
MTTILITAAKQIRQISGIIAMNIIRDDYTYHCIERLGANGSATTSFIAIRWKTTFLDEIAEMRHMQLPK